MLIHLPYFHLKIIENCCISGLQHAITELKSQNRSVIFQKYKSGSAVRGGSGRRAAPPCSPCLTMPQAAADAGGVDGGHSACQLPYSLHMHQGYSVATPGPTAEGFTCCATAGRISETPEHVRTPGSAAAEPGVPDLSGEDERNEDMQIS